MAALPRATEIDRPVELRRNSGAARSIGIELADAIAAMLADERGHGHGS
jgi:hypothetical protein